MELILCTVAIAAITYYHYAYFLDFFNVKNQLIIIPYCYYASMTIQQFSIDHHTLKLILIVMLCTADVIVWKTRTELDKKITSGCLRKSRNEKVLKL